MKSDSNIFTKPLNSARMHSKSQSKIRKKTRFRNNPLSLQDLQSNLLKNENFSISPLPEKLSFDKYSELINSSMKQYVLTVPPPRDSDDSDSEEKKEDYTSNQYITTEDHNIIKKVHDLNSSYISKYAPPDSDTNPKISIPEFNYGNPYQSVSIIRKNNLIYDEISKDYLIRQKMLFDNSIKTFEGYSMKYKLKMPKIRIAKIPPKINIEIPVVDMTKDKKKKEETVLPPIPGQEHLKLFAYYRYPNRNFPEGREQFSLGMKGADIILSGGMSASMKQMNIWQLNVESLEWKKIKTENYTNCRFGHSGIIFQNKIYYFGGRTKYSNTSLSTGFELFSFSDMTFSTPTVAGKTPELRRNHIAELMGTQMIIHGGISDNNDILNDVFILNFNPIKWNVVSINPFTPGPKLYGHSSSLVIPRDVVNNQRFTIYKYPDADNNKNKIQNNKLKERGLYIFGGKSKDEGGITNNLWILIMGKKPLEWVQPETKGKIPSPRYYHSMNYYEKGNFLIIHGGRNDDESESFALNDTYIFDLEHFEWMKVELYSELDNFKIIRRCGHNAIIYSNKLIILGGMNSHNYLGSSLLIVNLDFYYSSKIKTTEEMMIDKLKDNNDVESKKKLHQLKSNLQKNQLGVVKAVDLPPIM